LKVIKYVYNSDAVGAVLYYIVQSSRDNSKLKGNKKSELPQLDYSMFLKPKKKKYKVRIPSTVLFSSRRVQVGLKCKIKITIFLTFDSYSNVIVKQGFIIFLFFQCGHKRDPVLRISNSIGIKDYRDENRYT